jgi:hypothetical protein
MLAPLIDLVGECGETKATKRNGTKKKPWRWDSIHQQTFDNVKSTIAKEVVLAFHPDFTKPFEIYLNPRFGTNSFLEWELPNLEFFLVPTHN